MYPNFQPYYSYSYPYGYYNPQTVAPTPAPATPIPNVPNAPVSPAIKLDTVSGRTAADVYNVNVGEEAVLIDIDNPRVYKKTRSLDNKLTVEEYDLIPHIEETVANPASKSDLKGYVKQDEIDQIVSDRVKEEVDKRLSEISFTPKTTRKAKTVEE